MTGSVYPCGLCGEQNWVDDINDDELCPKCAELKVKYKKERN